MTPPPMTPPPPLDDLVHIQSIIGNLLPNDLELEPYEPIDHMAFHGSLHILVTKTELTDKVVAKLVANAAVVDHSFAPSPIPRRTERSIIVNLSSNVVSHHFALDKLTSENPQAQHPWYWWVQIAHLPFSLSTPFPSQEQYARYREIIIPHANVASAGDLRTAGLKEDVGYCQRMTAAMRKFDAISLTNRAGFCPIGGMVPASVRVIGSELLVLNERMAGLSQWLLVPDDFEGDAGRMLQDYTKKYSLADLSLGIKVRPGSAASTKLADIDPDTGRPSQALKRSIVNAYKTQRTTIKKSKVVPTNANAPTLPFIDVAFWVRTVSGDRKRASERIGRQVLSMIKNPPPTICPGFANVSKIIVFHEHTDRLDIELQDRMSVVELETVAKGCQVLTVNPARVVSRASEVNRLVQTLPDWWTLGIVDADGKGDGLDLELDCDLEGDEDEEEVPKPGVQTWRLVSEHEQEVERHVQACATMTSEFRFYRLEHRYMETWIEANQTAIKRSIGAFIKKNKLKTQHILIRISHAEEGQQTSYSRSLSRQRSFLLPVLPTPVEMLEYRYLSISKDSSPIVETLLGMSNAFVITASLDRVARTPLAMDQIVNICQARDIHLVSAIWPPGVAAQLAQYPNPLLSKATSDTFSSSLPISKAAKSMPMYYPVIVAGPNTNPDVAAIVKARVLNGQLFIDGWRYSAYQGDPWIEVDEPEPNVKPGAALLNVIVKQVREALPDYDREIHIAETNIAKEKSRCRCERGACADSCTCTCDKCEQTYKDRCPQKAKDQHPPFCPCAGHSKK